MRLQNVGDVVPGQSSEAAFSSYLSRLRKPGQKCKSSDATFEMIASAAALAWDSL